MLFVSQWFMPTKLKHDNNSDGYLGKSVGTAGFYVYYVLEQTWKVASVT
jgi:hypothetical protein